uniref:Reverse transcriptase domain-containing protein n=1 Tax=Tanacetum cinerariifolium TaxID=118510 RepID=A0A6L2JX18_TANCI|nr:hypothetical protein [Tanacetum cinerariifolium]
MFDSRKLILRLTATRALVTIQEIADHSHKWHKEEGDEMYYLSSKEVKCVKVTEYRENSLMVTPSNNSPSGNNPKLEEILGKYLEESCKRKGIFDDWMKIFRENTDKNLRKHDSAIKGLEENVARLAQVVKTHNKINQDRTLDIKRSIIISSLSVNSNLVHDRSMQSSMEIVENVLVKIDKFIFPMDFVIINIVEDNKVPTNLGRPMLATPHARIDIFGRKISLEVGTKKVVFNANEAKTLLSVCVINDFQVPKNFEEPKGLEEFLINDDINGD